LGQLFDVRFFLRVLIFFALAGLLWFVLTPAYNAGLVTTSNAFLALVEHPRQTTFSLSGDIILVSYEFFQPQHGRADLKYEGYQFHFNVVIFVALVLATSGLTRLYRLKALAAGLALLLISQVATLLIEATFQFVRKGVIPAGYGLAYGLSWGVVFLKGVGMLLFPLLIWAGLLFVAFSLPCTERVTRGAKAGAATRREIR